MAKKIKLQHIAIIMAFTGLSIGAIIFSEKQSEKQNRLSQTITPQTTTITQKQVISGNL